MKKVSVYKVSSFSRKEIQFVDLVYSLENNVIPTRIIPNHSNRVVEVVGLINFKFISVTCSQNSHCPLDFRSTCEFARRFLLS
jgi:hypothetical protein